MTATLSIKKAVTTVTTGCANKAFISQAAFIAATTFFLPTYMAGWTTCRQVHTSHCAWRPRKSKKTFPIGWWVHMYSLKYFIRLPVRKITISHLTNPEMWPHKSRICSKSVRHKDDLGLDVRKCVFCNGKNVSFWREKCVVKKFKVQFRFWRKMTFFRYD